MSYLTPRGLYQRLEIRGCFFLLLSLLQSTECTAKIDFTSEVKAGFLKLQCLVKTEKSADAVRIKEITSTSTNLAYIQEKESPEIETTMYTMYSSGAISESEARLTLLIENYKYTEDQTFECVVTNIVKGMAEYESRNVTVGKPDTRAVTTTTSTSTSTTTTTAAIISLSSSTSRSAAVHTMSSGESVSSFNMTALLVFIGNTLFFGFIFVGFIVHRKCGKTRPKSMEMSYVYERPPSTVGMRGIPMRQESIDPYRTRGDIKMDYVGPPALPMSNPPERNAIYRDQSSFGSNLTIPYIRPKDAISQECSDLGAQGQDHADGLVLYKSPWDIRPESPFYASLPPPSDLGLPRQVDLEPLAK